jgi:hypothetical protein
MVPGKDEIEELVRGNNYKYPKYGIVQWFLNLAAHQNHLGSLKKSHNSNVQQNLGTTSLTEKENNIIQIIH